jgi:glycosyltransferase involved in cell wall biosynthesis
VKFSTVIAAINDEARIGDAIASVAPCDDVIVIEDDRTSDDMAKVAQAAGARVFKRKLDGFASQKNFGIDKAKHDWVLILDTDERLSAVLRQAIEELEPQKGVAAYRFAWRNYLGSKWLAHGGLYPDYHTRLFNKRHGRYGEREIHETLEIDGETKTLEGDVLHLTYSDVRAYYNKVLKYARLEAEWTKNRPRLRSVVKEFLVRYFRQRGYRDGLAGLQSAGLMALYLLVVRRSMKQR